MTLRVVNKFGAIPKVIKMILKQKQLFPNIFTFTKKIIILKLLTYIAQFSICNIYLLIIFLLFQSVHRHGSVRIIKKKNEKESYSAFKLNRIFFKEKRNFCLVFSLFLFLQKNISFQLVSICIPVEVCMLASVCLQTACSGAPER